MIGTCQACCVDSLDLVRCPRCSRALCRAHMTGVIVDASGALPPQRTCKACDLDSRVDDANARARAPEFVRERGTSARLNETG